MISLLKVLSWRVLINSSSWLIKNIVIILKDGWNFWRELILIFLIFQYQLYKCCVNGVSFEGFILKVEFFFESFFFVNWQLEMYHLVRWRSLLPASCVFGVALDRTFFSAVSLVLWLTSLVNRPFISLPFQKSGAEKVLNLNLKNLNKLICIRNKWDEVDQVGFYNRTPRKYYKCYKFSWNVRLDDLLAKSWTNST